MKRRSALFVLVVGLAVSGCAGYSERVTLAPPDGAEQISVGRDTEYGAYLLARERLNLLQPGMSRGTFLRVMQLRRLPSEGWYTAFSGGDGWLVELSRKNQVGEDLVEEYSFGYREGRRVVERSLVVLRNGRVASVHEFPSSLDAFPPHAVSEIAEAASRQEENRLIQTWIRKTHLTRAAFARAHGVLKRARAGMTAGELRALLGGYFYRFRHGYVYFSDGFLWGPQFQTVETPSGGLALMPFGYFDGAKDVPRVFIKITDGVITEIIENPRESQKDVRGVPSKQLRT